MVVKVFYDTETTGTNWKLNSIHQLAGYIEIDGEVVDQFDIKMAPHPKAIIEPTALRICNVTLEQIQNYQSLQNAYKQFTGILSAYINRYETGEKAYLIGFNNRNFDDLFLRMFFDLAGDTFFNSWFWSDTQDVLILASHYLEDRRPQMPSFKLKRVATELGIVFDKEGLHDALFDATLTRQIYRIVTGLDLEI